MALRFVSFFSSWTVCS